MKALQVGGVVCLFLALLSVIALVTGGSTNFIGAALFFGAAGIGLLYALYTRERDQHRVRQADTEAQPKA
jgi:Na+/melibiose symporter-like transporter